MSVYTPNIPQATDNPSNSQSQILQNFQTLNNLYGTTGDHYPWTDTNSTEKGMHAKVTMPGLPSINAPGNALPTTQAGNCSIFSQTINSQTTPYLTRDGLAPTAPYTNIWPLLPIKAFANISINGVVATINSSFNISTVTTDGAGHTTINFANSMRTTNYGVFVTVRTSFSATPYSSPLTGSVIINTVSTVTTINVLILEP